MRAKDIIKATITGLDSELRGTFVLEEHTVSVGGACVGDHVEVEISSVSRHHARAFAHLRNALRRSEEFVWPPCPQAAPLRGQCGGCGAMHLSASVQDQARRAHVQALLAELGVENVAWIAAPEHLGYRNRSNYVVAKGRGESVVLGSYAPRGREVASMAGCLIVRPAISRVEASMRAVLERYEVTCEAQPQALRWVTLRASARGEVVVELVVRSAGAHWLEAIAADLMAIDGVQGIAVSVNDEATNAIRVGESHTLAGQTTLFERVGRVELEIPAGAFAQLNTDVASQMYMRAAELVSANAVVWDLYAGLGGLGLNVAAADKGTRVFGADSVATSIEAAERSAERHDLDAHFVVADLSQDLPANWPQPGAIIVNPPRRGLDEVVLKCLETSAATQLIYMSCGPASFARDASRLFDAGWRLDVIEAYDMLPQTPHVELLARFCRPSGREI
ncbi:MAG: 23S rRNA (uracil(1939)-C(5))-methyltransferase RlmD [Bradymonadaceae bacterium]|nr:23S rRNA (uracil(1939)-C(5))-methyltransferase RlmD [Lujinxingiaceae bacterium]